MDTNATHETCYISLFSRNVKLVTTRQCWFVGVQASWMHPMQHMQDQNYSACIENRPFLILLSKLHPTSQLLTDVPCDYRGNVALSACQEETFKVMSFQYPQFTDNMSTHFVLSFPSLLTWSPPPHSLLLFCCKVLRHSFLQLWCFGDKCFDTLSFRRKSKWLCSFVTVIISQPTRVE